MNLALLFEDDFVAADRVILSGRRLQHLREILQVHPGDRLTVGRVNGLIGEGTLLSLSDSAAELQVSWTRPPPPPLPLTLVIALPRPKMLKRILQTVATMGVKRLYFINAFKVEKSYWQSPWLGDQKLLENLTLGLEQGRDTGMPDVLLRPRFKPFVEDELPAIAADSLRLLAHPGTADACPRALQQACTLCIGPEGGFIPYEVALLEQAGFAAVHLGPRILRVETAVPVLISRLFDP